MRYELKSGDYKGRDRWAGINLSLGRLYLDVELHPRFVFVTWGLLYRGDLSVTVDR